MTAADVRYGIVGTGMMGLEHARNLAALPGTAITAVADTDAGSRGRAVELLGEGVTSFSDHRQLLASGLCDAVVIATPNMTHVEVLLDALGSDHHVLVEKPLCTTVADCRRAIEAARNNDRVVWVGLEYRYMPAVARLVDVVRNGAVGRLRMFALREHRYPFLAKVGDWNRFNLNTGGTLVEKCCHFFDLMRLVVGADPVRVMASGGQDVNHLDESYVGGRPDILDNAYVIVDFEGGVRSVLDLCMFADATRFQEELVAVGDAGKVEAFMPDALVRVGTRGRHWIGAVDEEIVQDDRVAHEGFHHGSSYIEHLGFLDAIRENRRPEVSLEDGLWSVAMGVAAHRSIDEGRAVAMSEVLSS